MHSKVSSSLHIYLPNVSERLVTFSSNPLILSNISVGEAEAELRVPEESSGKV